MVSGRVQIPTHSEPMKLAEPNPISLQSNGQRVTSVVASWGYYNAGGFVERGANEEDDILPVSYDSTGGASVSVTPRKLGKVRLTLFISFADGGVERKTIDLQVGHSAGQPDRLVITPLGGDRSMATPVLYMDLSEAHRTQHVFPSAIYKNVKRPVPLNASDVTYKIINGGAAEIDPSTGIVTALNLGQALLETSFEGVSTLTCIDVMENVGGGPRSRCENLLPPGRRLPPNFEELNPPRIKVR